MSYYIIYRIIIGVFTLLICALESYAQIDLKRDDYVGTTRRAWWSWWGDGSNTPLPSVNNGHVLFSLVDPIASDRPFSDSALWDGYPGIGGPYLNCKIKLRAKSLNPHKYGSRGWGLWYSEPQPNVQNQAWYMMILDDPLLTGLDWWRAETADGKTEAKHHFVELDQSPHIIDDQQWHVYEIDRQTDYIEFKIDGVQVFYATQDVPPRPMAFHIWVDNVVYEHVEPDIINLNLREWTGKNEIVLDYVQILTSGQLDKSEPASGIKLLRHVPNEIYDKETANSWYNLNFDSPGGQVVVLSTARVEQYLDANSQPISGDDDIRYVIDGTDYGWDSPNSFNADAQGTISKTLLFEKTMSPGNANIDVYGEISPLLYDVTVLGSTGGGIVFNQEYNEIKSSSSPELWKEISFQTHGGEVAIYVAGAADEDPTPSPSYQHGYQYSQYNDDEDDDIRIVLDGMDYGYRTEQSLYGNRLFGEPKSILITENLTSGTHTLRIYGQGTPEIFRVLIYGEMDDVSLPVSLTNFNISPEKYSNVITWQTASEINNLGFNIYRSVSTDHAEQMVDAFSKINSEIIPGAGTSSHSHDYQFEDNHIASGGTYRYYLEDISISGEITVHDTLKITRAINPQKFKLNQNYPNPFNGNTTISFVLSEKLNLILEIYNSSGKKIRTLTKGMHEPGNYFYDWNGKNRKGQPVASGIYYVRLSLSSMQASDVAKILYIK